MKSLFVITPSVVTNFAVVTACLGASLYTEVENSSFSVTAAIAGIIEKGSKKELHQEIPFPSSLYGYVESHSFDNRYYLEK